MDQIEYKLQTLGFTLENPKPPAGHYLGCKKAGNLLYASGRVSECKGAVGTDVSEEAAKQAARDTVLLILAIIKQDTGSLDMLEGVVKMQGFIRSGPGFINQPAVLDGASDLLIDIFGEAGRHARTATGVNQLPFGATIQLDIIFACR